ncbi:hypothetical protein KCU95_g10308, partial [Aureobasidium melanogenum]
MRFAIVLSALFATLAIAGPVMFEKRDKSECCCYQGGTYCFLYADQTATGCGDVDCEYIEDEDAGLTEGETETP